METFNTSRRRFLAILTALPAATALAQLTQTTGTATVSQAGGSDVKLPPLPYPYDALEPVIDKQTMQLHHDKHHAAYLANFTKALEKHPELKDKPVEELLADLTKVPEDIRTTVRNHGGGYYNHTLFWETMRPGGAKSPHGTLEQAIQATFSSVENFRAKFEEAGLKLFGSGWVWLVVTREKKLEIVTTPNQDTPLAQGAKPILGNDVWEHAYYLKYQNRRGDYLKAWWNVVNWDVAQQRFAAAMA
jgi:Fe-Mn family superoxide dismutase